MKLSPTYDVKVQTMQTAFFCEMVCLRAVNIAKIRTLLEKQSEFFFHIRYVSYILRTVTVAI